MERKKIIISVGSIVVVLLIIIIILFIAIPLSMNRSAKKALQNTISDTSSASEQLKEQEKEMFNQKFIACQTEEDETVSSATVSALFSMVANNNATGDRMVDVNGTTITHNNLQELKSLLNGSTQYKIKCIFDSEGYVKTIELRYL